MTQSYKNSFLVLVGLVLLLPIFFIPKGILSIDVAKSALLAFGTILVFLAFLAEYFKKGVLTIPWTSICLAVLLLPVVYLASSLVAHPSALSLLGYALEPGTFGFLLVGVILFLVSSMIFSDSERVVWGLGAFAISAALITLISAIKILTGTTALDAGVLLGKMGNTIGNWTDLGMLFGAFSVFTAIAIEMFPAKKSIKILLTAAFVVSTFLLVVTNFSTAFIGTLVVSILMFVYFSTVERRLHEGEGSRVMPWTVAVLLGISLLLLINPVVSSKGRVGDIFSGAFGISNTDVRPSLTTTLDISKQVLSENVLLGSGPNTFMKDWLVNKPTDINSTPYWSIMFPYGVGFVPTQIASTGALGTLAWIIFLGLFLMLGWKSLKKLPHSKIERFSVVTTFLMALFLWIAACLYVPSSTMLILAFIFTGLFVASARISGTIETRQIRLADEHSTNLVSAIFGIVLFIGAVVLGFGVFQRTASAFHYAKAIEMSNTSGSALADIESELGQAINLAPHDIYYDALARLSFAKAQAVIENADSASDAQKLFQDSLATAIQAAKSAVAVNPSGYTNWTLLGSVYSSLVADPLKVDGAYENAKTSFDEARKLNPSSPEVPLLEARLELDHNNIDQARSYAREAIALKPDYADAYLFAAQLEVSQNNLPEAIKNAEAWALLTPNNAGVFFELGLLKYSAKDYNGAGQAFAQALQITPDYANAEYYLGMTLLQLGRLTEAKPVFENLAVTNPDNADLKSIIGDLTAGKNPLNTTPARASK